MTDPIFLIENGESVRCKVTGFKGIVTCRTEWANGCIRYEVAPKVDKDGKMSKSEWIDEADLEVLREKKWTDPAKVTKKIPREGKRSLPSQRKNPSMH